MKLILGELKYDSIFTMNKRFSFPSTQYVSIRVYPIRVYTNRKTKTKIQDHYASLFALIYIYGMYTVYTVYTVHTV